jgi:hypothetical protein
MLRTYLVCREKQADGAWEKCTNSDPIPSTSELLLRQNSVTAHASNLRLADLRLTTAQKNSTGQNLPSDL